MSLLTHAEIKKYLEMAPKASPENRAKIQALLEMDKIERSKKSFLYFELTITKISNVDNGDINSWIVSLLCTYKSSCFNSCEGLSVILMINKFTDTLLIHSNQSY